ncbi:MAG: 30S ribosomal protein S6e [Candidatus Nanoarchaeia archaeon]
MADVKLIIGDPKSKRTFKTEIKGSDTEQLFGKKIGDTFRGELIGLPGFEFQITGGSDKAGFPMNPDLEGQSRKRLILSGKTQGYIVPKKFKGRRERRLVRGNTIAADIAQINCKIVKYGDIDLMKHFNIIEKPKEEKEKKEKPAEAPPQT